MISDLTVAISRFFVTAVRGIMTCEPNRPRPSILVAEDDRVMSDVLRFTLEKAGYTVTIARNGNDAWLELLAHDFDFLVTDFQMPGRSGVELCREIRRQFPERELPVLLLSARGLELNAARLKDELAISEVLFKPFSPSELVQKIAGCLAAAPRKSKQPAADTVPST